MLDLKGFIRPLDAGPLSPTTTSLTADCSHHAFSRFLVPAPASSMRNMKKNSFYFSLSKVIALKCLAKNMPKTGQNHKLCFCNAIRINLSPLYFKLLPETFHFFTKSVGFSYML
ncbi:MAG: hypothetical protein D6785_05885 [Planctomycetota bacterium]|nr:MAG: hypothetical protein D6785_05885 [Planctomycetota bacterium]